jgi:hypothetical protein
MQPRLVIQRVAGAQDGVVTRQQAMRAGLTGQDIRGLVRSGG